MNYQLLIISHGMNKKAVIVLLALLYLGVKNIKLGPTLPAFLSPNVAKVLVDNFGISGINSVEEDIKSLYLKLKNTTKKDGIKTSFFIFFIFFRTAFLIPRDKNSLLMNGRSSD